MKNISAVLIFCTTFMAAHAQKVSLKHALTKADTVYLEKLTQESVDMGGAFSMQSVSSDFTDPGKIVPDKPFNISDVQKLEKKLKNSYEDAAVYYDIGMMYKYNFNKEKAMYYLNKSLEQGLLRVKAKPDSASSYSKLGLIYFRLDNYDECIKAYEKAIALNPSDTLIRAFLPGAHLYKYDLKGTLAAIRKNTDYAPNNPAYYELLPLYYFIGPMYETSRGGYMVIKERYFDKRVDEITDLGLIRSAYENNPGNKKMEMIYNISRLNVLISKIMMVYQLDTVYYEGKKISFPADAYDLEELARLETYFKSLLTDPAIVNKYVVYRSLGYLSIIKNEAKQAAAYFQSAIKQRPLNKSRFESNAATDYDNLAGAYLIMTDTAAYEKTVQEKFKVKPEINVSPVDYINMSKIAFFHKKYDDALTYAKGALAIYPESDQAYLIMAAIDIQKKNYKAAFANLDSGYKLNRQDNTFQYLSGVCLLLMNDPQTAYLCFQAAKNNEPNSLMDKEVFSYFFDVK